MLERFDLSALDGLRPDDVDQIDFSMTAVRDKDLIHIAHLSRLRMLSLNGTRATSAGLAHLSGLIGLETLNLSGSDADLGGLGIWQRFHGFVI